MAVETIVIKGNPVTGVENYARTAVRRSDVRTYAELTFAEEDFESEERTVGGPWGMRATMFARNNILYELFENGLQRIFEAWGYGLTCAFQGLAHEMVLTLPPNVYIKSMDPVFNSVLMRSDIDGDGAAERTGPFTDQDSVDRWSTIQRVFSGGQIEGGASVAEQTIKAALELSKHPKFEPQLSRGRTARETKLEVFCRGIAWTLQNEVYNQTTNTGTQSLTTLIGLLLDAAGDYITSRDLGANATPVAEEFDADQTPWEILANHIQVSDSNLDRWTFHMVLPTVLDVEERRALLEKTAPRTPPPVES